MKKLCFLMALLGLWPALGVAQTMGALLDDGKNPDNVLNQSMGSARFPPAARCRHLR
jgi:hypothetical protein